MHNITIEHFMGHFIVSSPRSDFRSLFNLLAPQQDKMEMKARTLWDREGGAVLSLFKLKAEFASTTLSREDFWARHEVEFRRVASCLRSWWNRRAKTREESESKQLESERSRLCNQVLSLSLLSTSFAEMYRDSTCSDFVDELLRILESVFASVFATATSMRLWREMIKDIVYIYIIKVFLKIIDGNVSYMSSKRCLRINTKFNSFKSRLDESTGK